MVSPVLENSPPADRRPPRWYAAVRLLGELMVTAGVLLLLFVFYLVYITDWFTARHQAEAGEKLRTTWEVLPPPGQPLIPPPPPRPGDGFAQLYLPEFGPKAQYTVLEGTGSATLADGPGHYIGTALPGEQGNFAIAGHRIGRGAPFHDLDKLTSCAPLIVETATHWYIYRVLPMSQEVPFWDGHDGAPKCQGVAPIGGPYTQVVGRRIVDPGRVDVLEPVPGQPPGVLPADRRSRLITLTTCHPEFSARERMIVHGVLTTEYPKIPGRAELRPPELEEF